MPSSDSQPGRGLLCFAATRGFSEARFNKRIEELALSMSKGIASGATVNVLSSKGKFLAHGAYSHQSQIRVRTWTFEDEAVNEEFFRKRIRAALTIRNTLFPSPLSPTNALRLIYAESDGIPGLIVDRYDDILVLQSLTAGSEHWKETIAELLLEETGLKNIYERSDADVRELKACRRA